MNDDREIRDLAPLDPRGEPRRWEAMVQGINRAAAGEIARRATPRETGVIVFLAGWRRPAAAVCGAIAACAAAILLLQPRSTEAEDGGFASALGYPRTVAEWVEADWSPSVEELLFALEDAE
jgi:hypothetical protein